MKSSIKLPQATTNNRKTLDVRKFRSPTHNLEISDVSIEIHNFEEILHILNTQ